MPFNVRQVKEFPFQAQIWEDSYNRPSTILDKERCAEDLFRLDISLHYLNARFLLWKLCAAEVQPSEC
jgi:hypothetical protein